MMKLSISTFAGLALAAWLAAPVSADDDAIVVAIDRVITPLNSAESSYTDFFTGDKDEHDIRERNDRLDLFLEAAETCSASVKEALKVAPPSSAVHLYHREIKLADGEAICDRLRVATKKAIEEAKAAEEARLAPFKKALKGDRLSLWMKYQQGFHGPGCRAITTPAQLAKAKSWYIILEDDSGVVYRWTTRQYSFKGDKLVVSAKERTGTGRNPPSKACP